MDGYDENDREAVRDGAGLTTCRFQGVDPYTYLVDLLQRVSLHPACDVEQLTPRRWKDLFAAQPLRSDPYGLGQIAARTERLLCDGVREFF